VICKGFEKYLAAMRALWMKVCLCVVKSIVRLYLGWGLEIDVLCRGAL